MVWKMHLTKQHHELLESHPFKVFTLKFDPVDKMYVLDPIEGTFDNLVSRDVFIVHEAFASPFPVHAGLRSWVSHTHIWRF